MGWVFAKNHFSIFLDFLSQEQLKENKMRNLTKLQYLNDKKYQNTNFAKLPSVNCLFLG